MEGDESAYESPSDLADEIREVLRVMHQECNDLCPFKFFFAEDVQEILDIAERLTT